jgi:hypothetical protein
MKDLNNEVFPQIAKQGSQVYMSLSGVPGAIVEKIPGVEPEPELSEMKVVRKG